MPNFLFGFATTRNASTISDHDRVRFHVHMEESDRQDTRFWSNLDRDTFEGLKQEVRRRAVGAAAPLDLRAIREQHADRITFYREVKSEGRRGSLADLSSFVEGLGLAPLTRSERIALWDAYAFYLWVDPQRDEIDTLNAVFIADKLLEELRVALADNPVLSDADEAALRRVAQARIVLPLRVDNRLTTDQPPRLSHRQRRLLEDAHDQIVAGARLVELESARDEILDAVLRVRRERADTNRREDTDRTARIRESLAGRLAANDLETVVSDLSSTLRLQPTSSEIREEVAFELVSANARRLFDRHTRRGTSMTSALTTLEADIDSSSMGKMASSCCWYWGGSCLAVSSTWERRMSSPLTRATTGSSAAASEPSEAVSWARAPCDVSKSAAARQAAGERKLGHARILSR